MEIKEEPSRIKDEETEEQIGVIEVKEVSCPKPHCFISEDGNAVISQIEKNFPQNQAKTGSLSCSECKSDMRVHTRGRNINMKTLESQVAELVQMYPHLYDRTRRDFKDTEKTINSWKEIATKLGVGDPELCKVKWRNVRDKFTKAMKRMRGKSGDDATSTKVPRLFLEMSWLRPFVRLRQTVSNLPSFEKVEGDDFLKKVVAEELSPSTPSPSTAPPSSSSGPTSDSEEDEQSSTITLGDLGTYSSTPCKAATNSVMQSSLSSPPPVPCNKRKRKRDSADDGHGQLLFFLKKDKTDSFDRHAQIVADFMRKLPPRHCAIFKKRIQDIMFDTEMQLLDEQDNGTTH